MNYRRYAIYFTPEPGPMAEFGAAWLGWDPVTGAARAHPEIAGLPRPIAEVTSRPRKYGFHGTLKPPFRLSEGTTVAELTDALADFAANRAAATCAGLQLSRIDGFLALTPDGDAAEIDELAGSVVSGFDRFRAPMTNEDRARRVGNGLTATQKLYLDHWGYPYVMDEFRFHMTLSIHLPEDDGALIAKALAPHVAPFLPRPFRLDALTLLGEDDAGMFHSLHRYALSR